MYHRDIWSRTELRKSKGTPKTTKDNSRSKLEAQNCVSCRECKGHRSERVLSSYSYWISRRCRRSKSLSIIPLCTAQHIDMNELKFDHSLPQPSIHSNPSQIMVSVWTRWKVFRHRLLHPQNELKFDFDETCVCLIIMTITIANLKPHFHSIKSQCVLRSQQFVASQWTEN